MLDFLKMNADYEMSTKIIHSKWRTSSYSLFYLQVFEICWEKLNLKIIIGEHNHPWEKQYKNTNSFPNIHINLCLKLRLFLPGISDGILSFKQQKLTGCLSKRKFIRRMLAVKIKGRLENQA